MTRKLLFISMCLPFPRISHAGGQIFNYYVNRFAECEDNEITLIAKVLPGEERYLDTVNPRIDLYTVSTPKEKFRKYFTYIKSAGSKFNPFYKYGNVLTKHIYDEIEKKLKLLKEKGYEPDVVSLEWTSMLLFIDTVKKYFPKARYITTEHDVSFQGAERRYISEQRYFKKLYYHARFRNIKKRELRAVNICDLIFVLNHKDRRILLQEGVPEKKTDVLVPYFNKPEMVNRHPEMNTLLFYGAMSRKENYRSVIWFIENVMPTIEDLEVKLLVVGSRPPEILNKYASDRVMITGYVEDPAPYFEKATCMVASLVLGAGIKIKVLEAMAMGIPVLTNDIGIEGIDAVDGVSYLHCETPGEYERAIRDILNGKTSVENISAGALKMIQEKYDFEAAFHRYSERIYSLITE